MMLLLLTQSKKKIGAVAFGDGPFLVEKLNAVFVI